MIGYVLMYKGEYIGVYKTHSKAIFKVLQLCKKDNSIMRNFENLKKQERLLKRNGTLKANEGLTFFKYITYIYADSYEIEAFEME